MPTRRPWSEALIWTTALKDGAISDEAQDVLGIVEGAYAAYSPSHTGLHLYFLLPQGFVFDRDEYYINNRNSGMEIYLPGVTRHFLTLPRGVGIWWSVLSSCRCSLRSI